MPALGPRVDRRMVNTATEESEAGRTLGEKDFVRILRYSEEESEPSSPPPPPTHYFFFFFNKSLLEARVIYMQDRPGNPAGLLELAMNRNRGIVSRPLDG